jgi:hypothetical protein
VIRVLGGNVWALISSRVLSLIDDVEADQTLYMVWEV